MFVHRFHIAIASLAFALTMALTPQAARAQATTVPAAAPSATPTPNPALSKPFGAQREDFVIGDYLISPTIYNESTSGHSGRPSFTLRAGTQFSVDNMPFMFEAEITDWAYTHFAGPPGNCAVVTGCITNIGHTGQTYRPARNLADTDTDGRVGYRVAWPRIYVAVDYLGKSTTLNYPVVNGVGVGLEKLPDFERTFTAYASFYYYPDLEGKFTVYNRTTNQTTVYTFTYHVIRYQAGVMYAPWDNHQAYIDAGVMGDGVKAGAAAPGSQTHLAEYVGAGLFVP
jgi:hypothetical protein